ncbi:MAG: sensor histidine kinase [Sphaerobacter sp.]|nr:sensor histidine kinase [Sphaerobacter sp.]
MSGRLPDALSAVKQAIDEGIGGLEGRLDAIATELRSTLAELERERAQVQRAVEERELSQRLGTVEPGRGPSTAELRRREDVITHEYMRVTVLYRQLTDFLGLLASSRQQFRAEEKLPGHDDAQRLAIRQAMIRAQEGERHRLAREIHDGPAQVLANAIIGLEFVERSICATASEQAQHLVSEIERIKLALREGLTEIRRFIFDLRPTMLTQRGLAATIEHYIETYRKLFSSEVELVLPPRMPRLTPEQELTAFRVIQEALQNVQRHARSTRVQVSITCEDDQVTVRVRDNGQGFRPSAVRATSTSGFGLTGMQERAEVIGGRVTVRSRPGKGTEVTLVMPLTRRSVDEPPDAGQAAGRQVEGDSVT